MSLSYRNQSSLKMLDFMIEVAAKVLILFLNYQKQGDSFFKTNTLKVSSDIHVRKTVIPCLACHQSVTPIFFG